MLFDGKCNLCNAGVQLILDHDRADVDARGNLRVAAMQSRVGKLLLMARLSEAQRAIILGSNANHGKKKERSSKTDGGAIIANGTNEDAEEGELEEEEEVEYKSILVVTPTTVHLNSNACLQIGRQLSGPLRYLALAARILLPNLVRDVLYRQLSKYRKRLFGTSAECRLWDDNWDTRFVDDAVLTGEEEEGGGTTMFADPNAVATTTTTTTTKRGVPLLREGDVVRVVSSVPIVHTHVPGYDGESGRGGGICTVGSVGTVTRVLDERAYPKNVAVKFELDVGGYNNYDDDDDDNNHVAEKGRTCSFEAHYLPWQLRRE